MKPSARSSHTNKEAASTGWALERQLQCFFSYNIVHPPLSRALNTAHCFLLETVQENGFVSKSASSSSAANLQPLSELSNLSAGWPRTPPFVISVLSEMCFCLCVLGPLLGRRAAAGRRCVHTHTHTHSTADLQLSGSGCSLEPHTNIPHSPVQRFSFLTRSHRLHRRFLRRRLSHSVCPPQTKSHLTSHFATYSALKRSRCCRRERWSLLFSGRFLKFILKPNNPANNWGKYLNKWKRF